MAIIDKKRLEAIERLRKEAQYKREHKEEVLMDWIRKNLVEREKPFTNPDEIPDMPVVKNEGIYKELIVPNLIRLGAIPKKNLVVGKEYVGACRNAENATWNGNEFEYNRYKFGEWFKDTTNHFEDFTTYDIFIPIREK